jgi:hypothetical protein
MTVRVIIRSADRPPSGGELERRRPIVDSDHKVCGPIFSTLVPEGSIASAYTTSARINRGDLNPVGSPF